MEILEGLHAVRIADADGLDTEVYLLDCEEGVILVDVGFTPQCLENISLELKNMGRKWGDVKMVIITHAHGDHILNLPQVKELTDAEVVVGLGDEERLLERTGVKADVALDTGDIIGAFGNIEVIRVPGHSRGNLSLLLHKHRALIAGDTIFGDQEGNLEAPPEKYCEDVGEATRNLSTLLNYDFDALLLSHGANILSGAKERVRALVEKCV